MTAEIASKFLSDLHRTHLKAKGYRKRHHTFTRSHAGFSEHVQFQGSAWNSPATPWRFYINVGVQFPDFPQRVPDRDLPGTHCWTRIEAIVPEAPPEFELGDQGMQVGANLARLVEAASQRVAERIDAIREEYERTRSPHLSLGVMWPFDQGPKAAAITTAGVLERGLPILLVQHYADDHSWAFLCGTTDGTEDGRVVGMATALRLDPTLESIADLPPGWVARRHSVGDEWIREPNHEHA